MVLPNPAFDEPAEPFATADETVCDLTPKPGVVAWADFLTKNVGGQRGRITKQACSGQSGHNAGRAFDWMISALDPEQKAKADAVIEWLLANDAEMFRRVGLSYIIWDKKIWGARSKVWKPYDGYAADGSCSNPPCRDPHTNHVHFSFNEPGAAGQTSFYRWLGGARPTRPVPSVPASPSSTPWLHGVVGALLGFGIARWWGNRKR